MRSGPMRPQMTEAEGCQMGWSKKRGEKKKVRVDIPEKKTRPPGQVK